MELIGKVTLADLDKLDRAVLTPKQVHDRIVAEGKARRPGKVITIQRAALHRGFDIVAL